MGFVSPLSQALSFLHCGPVLLLDCLSIGEKQRALGLRNVLLLLMFLEVKERP
jgi:hypothetical protein